MRMILRRLAIRQKHTRMMIQLYQNNRTLHAEVERIVVAKATNPAKVRFVEVRLYLRKFEIAGLGWVVE